MELIEKSKDFQEIDIKMDLDLRGAVEELRRRGYELGRKVWTRKMIGRMPDIDSRPKRRWNSQNHMNTHPQTDYGLTDNRQLCKFYISLFT
jgi:hypothetical protein